MHFSPLTCVCPWFCDILISCTANDGDFSKVETFLDKGVDANKCDSAGYTALHYAAMKGHLDICLLLFKFGADVNAQTRAGKATALHRACSAGRWLISFNLCHSDEKNVLVILIVGKEKIIRLLLDRGADVELLDADGRNALHRAYINGCTNAAELLATRYPQLLSIIDIKNKRPKDYYDENMSRSVHWRY